MLSWQCDWEAEARIIHRSLALEGYLADPKNKDARKAVTLDLAFAKLVSNHIRLFLFTGNNTTSSTIVFASTT